MNEVKQNEDQHRIYRHRLPMAALGLDIFSDSERAYVACMDGVYELDIETGEFQKLYAHESYVSGIVCVPETNGLVSAGYDGALQWYDLKSRQAVRHVQAHSFWSWDLARAKNKPVIASVSGQYLAGSYDYRPKPSAEPCVRLYDAISGDLLSSFHHLPPVQAVTISDDGDRIGAGNLMGDVAVWSINGDQQEWRWNTTDFTGFGIIKSHCQIGGIYAATFANPNQMIVAGMGPMRDPMAGNGKQRWRCIDITTPSVQTVFASNDDQVGEGLMETLAMHPDGAHFAMAGRLRGGNWNVGIFNLHRQDLVHSLKTGTRVTKAQFSGDGRRLILAGADKQTVDETKAFGVVDVYEVSIES